MENNHTDRRYPVSLILVIVILLLLEGVSRLLFTGPADESVPGKELRKVGEANRLRESDEFLWEFTPNSVSTMGDHRVIINSMGFRDDEIPVEKAPGEFRIICLGDSLYFGEGIRLKNTFYQVLETKLQKKFPDRMINVIGCGVPGYSSLQSYRQLKIKGLLLDPDVVLIGSLWSDNNRDYFTDKSELRKATVKKNLHKSRLYFTLKRFFFTPLKQVLKLDPKQVKLQPMGDMESLNQRVSVKDYEKTLKKMADLCRDRNITAVFLIAPHEFDVGIWRHHSPRPLPGEPLAWDDYRNAMRRVAKEHGYLLLDLAKVFKDIFETEDRLLLQDYMHPDNQGHEVMADHILKNLLNLPGRPLRTENK